MIHVPLLLQLPLILPASPFLWEKSEPLSLKDLRKLNLGKSLQNASTSMSF